MLLALRKSILHFFYNPNLERGYVMCKKHRTRWSVIKDPRFGPLGIYLEAFEKRLSEQGYAQSTIDYKVRIVRHLNKWLHQKRLSIKDLNEQKVTRFLSYWSKSHLIHLGYLSTFKNLLGWLRQSDIVPTPTPKNDHSELGRILQDYRFYLRKERGLTPATLKNYLPKVGRFLFGCFETGAVLRNDLRPKVVMNFLFSQARIYSPRTVQLVATALRSFLRFLRFRGDIGLDLAASVPTVANRGWPDLPKYLQLEDVNQLLKSCDRTCAAGLRDYAIYRLPSHNTENYKEKNIILQSVL